jgi:hypothetical protein
MKSWSVVIDAREPERPPPRDDPRLRLEEPDEARPRLEVAREELRPERDDEDRADEDRDDDERDSLERPLLALREPPRALLVREPPRAEADRPLLLRPRAEPRLLRPDRPLRMRSPSISSVSSQPPLADSFNRRLPISERILLV